MTYGLTSVLGISVLAATLIGWMGLSKGYSTQKRSGIPWISFLPFFGKKSNYNVISEKMNETGHKIVMVNTLGFSAVFVGDADLVKYILKDESGIKKAPFLPSPAISKMMGSGRTILHANGEEWRKHREISGPSFTFDTISGYHDKIVDSGLEMFDYIKRAAGVPDVGVMMTSLTIDILGKTIFGYDFGALRGEASPYLKAYFDVMEEFNSALRLAFLCKIEHLTFIPSNLKLKNATTTVNSLITEIVERKMKKRLEEKQRKESSGQQASQQQPTTQHYDVVDCLIESLDEVEESKRMDMQELLGDIVIFFMAGHETTASALSWACILLSQHQEIQQKAYEEISQVLKGKLPTFDDLKELLYLNMVIKEVLRKSSPVSQMPGRVLFKDTPLPGTDYTLPKGAALFLSVSHIHNDPLHWKNPEVFDPERFTPENSKGRHPFAFLPFSHGKRQCIGQQFSMVEQQIILALLIQKYKIVPHGSIAVKKGIILNAPDHVRISFVER